MIYQQQRESAETRTRTVIVSKNLVRKLFIFVFASVGLFGTCRSEAAADDGPLNVLLITADDLGVQLGCYGDAAARTPNLDALAARGCLFENAYVAQASCSPSRSAMFTGLYPHTNGQYGLLNAGVGFTLTPEAQRQTIPAILKPAGYTTGILGKLHVGDEAKFPFDKRIQVDTRDVRVTADKAAEFFDSADGPFFFMANYSDPHVQGRSPQFPKEAFPTQYKGIPPDPIRVGEVPSFPFQQLDDPQQIARTTQYYNAAKRFDYGVGLLLQRLEAAGHADDTLIIFVGDHGPPFFRGKTFCYEAGVHVPMLVVWPSVLSAGTRSAALVSTVDILPTIMDAIHSNVFVETQGKSLRSAKDIQFRDYLATEFHYHGGRPFFPRRSIRDQRFKLIHNLRAGSPTTGVTIDGDSALKLARASTTVAPEVLAAYELAAKPPEFELYDLESDPNEFQNLATSTEHADVLQRLKNALTDWRKQTNDPLLSDDGWAKVAKYESVTPN